MARIVFLDFDGVIKDSVDAKGIAFAAAFRDFGPRLGDRILAHHRANGGMSRLQKIPLYASWAGVPTLPDHLETFMRAFEVEARRAVLQSPWVPGALEFLARKQRSEAKVIVSATPEQELRSIAEELGIACHVESLIGTPTAKADAIRSELHRLVAKPGDCVMVGDSMVDLEAAEANGVPFILRRHADNAALAALHSGRSIDDLREL